MKHAYLLFVGAAAWLGTAIPALAQRCTSPIPTCSTGGSANLVANGSFEDTYSCPAGLVWFGGTADATVYPKNVCSWQPATWATPDLFSSCANNTPAGASVGVPCNFATYCQPGGVGEQPARTGQQYGGLIGFKNYNHNVPDAEQYREYIMQPMSTVKLRPHYAEFYVGLASRSGLALTHGLGMALSTSAGMIQSGNEPLNLAPVITAPVLTQPGWQKASGVFTPSSTDKSIVIGYFGPGIDGNGVTPYTVRTPQSTLTPISGDIRTSAYYFIDDVTVLPVPAPVDPFSIVCGRQSSPQALSTDCPLPASANATYEWQPSVGLDDPHSANPHVVNLSTTTTYTLTVKINGQPVTMNGQPYAPQVTVTVTPASTGCPCDHEYKYVDAGTGSYQVALHTPGNRPYEIGTANQLTVLDARLYPNNEIVFEGTYHVLGPISAEHGTVRLKPGTTFYFDPDQAYLVANSCYPAVGLDEYASRFYVGADGNLVLDQATLTSTCERMWGGVTLTGNGELHSDNGSIIRDAYVGVMAGEYCQNPDSHYYINKTDFLNCYYGFMDLEKASVKTGEGVTYCSFISDQTTMLAPLAGKYGLTGMVVDGKNLTGLALHHNSFDRLLTGAEVSGGGTVFAQNNFVRCYARAIGVGVYYGGGPFTRNPTVTGNIINVPNSYFSTAQINQNDLVAGIVLNDPRSSSIIVSQNSITGGGSTPTSTLKLQAGIVGFSYNLFLITGQNSLYNLDYGVKLLGVSTYQPANGPALFVSDNLFQRNTYHVYMEGNGPYAFSTPWVECNTLNNSTLSSTTYGIYLSPNAYVPVLGSNDYPGGNTFTSVTRPVWNQSGYATTYWRYSTENTANSGAAGSGSALTLSPSSKIPSVEGCAYRGYLQGVNNRQALPTPHQVASLEQQVRLKQGSGQQRWQAELQLACYSQQAGRQAELEAFVMTLPRVNDTAFYRLGFYLLSHYQHSGQAGAAARLRGQLLRYGSHDVNVMNTLTFTEVMNRLAGSRIGLSAADSLLLANVAQSGAAMADAACTTLRRFHPHAVCGEARQLAPAEAAPQLPRISGLYPNPAADQVTVSCSATTGDLRVVVRDLRTGKVVSQATVQAKGGAARLSVRGLAAGLYVCQLEQNGRVVAVERLEVAR